jgi:hypothetical protein
MNGHDRTPWLVMKLLALFMLVAFAAFAALPFCRFAIPAQVAQASSLHYR